MLTVDSIKMSYFSDMDLSTLHKSRLNERIQYKLSCRNKKSYSPSSTCSKQSHTTSNCQYEANRIKNNDRISILGNDNLLPIRTTEHSETLHGNSNVGSSRNQAKKASSINNSDLNKQQFDIGAAISMASSKCSSVADPDSNKQKHINMRADKKQKNSDNQSNGNLIESDINANTIASAENCCNCTDLTLCNHVIDANFAVPHRKRSGTWP